MSLYQTVSCSVTGHRKAEAGKLCEDATRVIHTKEVTVMAVADGHGDSRCIFAHVGAALAVKGACAVLRDNAAGVGAADPSAYWNARRSEIARSIACAFALSVLEDYAVRCPDRCGEEELAALRHFVRERYQAPSSQPRPPAVLRAMYLRRQQMEARLLPILSLYGTTLRATVLGKDYLFHLAVGDGDTVLLTPDEALWALPATESFSTETASLCEPLDRLLESFLFSFVPLREGAPTLMGGEGFEMLVLSTDGLRNSFCSDGQFLRYLSLLKKRISKRGTAALSAALRPALGELSRNSVFQDDISLILAVKKA